MCVCVWLSVCEIKRGIRFGHFESKNWNRDEKNFSDLFFQKTNKKTDHILWNPYIYFFTGFAQNPKTNPPRDKFFVFISWVLEQPETKPSVEFCKFFFSLGKMEALWLWRSKIGQSRSQYVFVSVGDTTRTRECVCSLCVCVCSKLKPHTKFWSSQISLCWSQVSSHLSVLLFFLCLEFAFFFVGFRICSFWRSLTRVSVLFN